MMIAEFISHYRKRGLKLRLDGGKLRFDAPKGFMTPAIRADLKARKQEIIDHLGERRQPFSPKVQMVQHKVRDGDLLLSFAQERLWFLDQVERYNAGYHQPIRLHLVGLLNLSAMEVAINHLIARHEILRTRFRAVDGAPTQRIASMESVSLLPVMLMDLEPGPREEEMNRLALREARDPFDMEKGPLLRVLLLRLGHREHLLVLNMHHIITDGWSSSVFIRELIVAYRALSEHRPISLPPLPVQYTDYVYWQREHSQSQEMATHMNYWLEKLAQPPRLSALPMDFPRPAENRHRGRPHFFVTPIELTARVRRFGSSNKLTVFMTMLGAFQALLHRYSGLSDILIGSPVVGRPCPELEPLMGMFTNNVVFRLDCAGNPSVAHFLDRVRAMSLAALEHQDAPFEKLVEKLNPERSLSHNPLFQAVFNFQAKTMGNTELPDLKLMPGKVEHEAIPFDLILELTQDSQNKDKLMGRMEYDTDLFKHETIVRMVSHFLTLLDGMISDVNRPLGLLPVIDDGERFQLLVALNDTDQLYGHSLLMHQLFEHQVERTPEAVALMMAEDSMSYRSLNERANRLAHYLISQGIGAEQLVGVCCFRNFDMAVAVLAIQKAGAGYVPLDIAYPADRKSYILGSLGTHLFLSHQGAVEQGGLPATPLFLDQWSGEGHDATNPQPRCVSQNIAYIIFTSGSTGRPKGVIIRHHTAINLIEWVNDRYKVGPSDRLLFTTSLCFDLSVYDIFGILACGGTTFIANEDDVRAPESLARILVDKAITFWDSAPAALLQLVPFLPEPSQATTVLRLVFLSGDWVPLSLPPALLQVFPNLELIALGGATEATIWSNFFSVKDIHPQWKSVPYGNPIQNARYYILDRYLEPAPFNIPGDLYIAGNDCLSYGYFMQPGLTGERYLPDPFSKKPGAFLYTTGDRARWLSAGHMEFLGRIDAQVKIRGYRIELGEIESVLQAHEDVLETAVLAREDVPGDIRLVAYVQMEKGIALCSENLASALAKALPEYMLPKAYVAMEQWPVTSNGKLNRKALPVPDLGVCEENFAAPQSVVEEQLVEIWSSFLDVSKLGIDDNFFDLGGHSLTATKVVARIRSAFNLDLPVRALFTEPTIRELAAFMDTLNEDSTASLVPIPRLVDHNESRLAYAQERLWYFAHLAPGSYVYNLPAAVRLKGHLNADALVYTFQTIVNRHDVLRSLFPMVDGRPTREINPTDSFTLKRIDLSQEAESHQETLVSRYAQQDMEQPFDLERGPVFRVTLLRLNSNDHVLLWCMHHIVADGLTVANLVREFNILYGAAVHGQEPELPGLPIRYGDYVSWLRDPARDAENEAEMDYWRGKLAGTPTVLQLPSDRPRGSDFNFRGRELQVEWSADLIQRVRDRCLKENVTTFMFLLTAIQLLMFRYSGQKDIWIGSPVANRKREQLAPLFGLFFNTLVFRTDLSGKITVSELLARVRETALGAYEHEGIQFEHLIEEISPERDLSHNPLYQVMFALQTTLIPDLDLPGLEAQPFKAENLGAKFDMILDLIEFPHSEDGVGLRGRIEYNTDLFEHATVVRLERHLRQAIEAMISHPEQLIDQLSILDDAERRLLIYEHNDTRSAYNRTICMHQLFEKRVALTPDSLALIQGEHTMTYGALEERANRVAHFLLARGVRPETLVGICCYRNFDMIVAVLAIQKAGAAYVPMDAQYPGDRIAYILADIKADICLTHRAIAAKLPDLDCELACLDDFNYADYEPVPPKVGVGPENTAYIIFTSGSTGRPKGVIIRHMSAINLIEWVNDTYRVDANDRLLFTTSLCFDLSVYDIFGSLAAGGTVYVASDDDVTDPIALAKLLNRRDITFWDSAPAALVQLTPFLAEAGSGSTKLRLVFLSGDWIPLTLPPTMQQTFPNVQVIALGGATEATIWSNYFPVDRILPEWTSIPYGKPINNASYFVLDEQLQAVPINVSGDLYIGDECLSLGYFNQPSLTASRYIPDPYSSQPGSFMYQTGDRARWKVDGNIEFLGRLDAQVKIRGFRIELGEVESVLVDHELIREAVVMARDDKGEKRLVAYIQPLDQSQQIEDEQFREIIRERLPEYMMPSAFVTLHQWPVTANGKLDRKALPKPELELDSEEYTAPRNDEEAQLVTVWQEVLGIKRVGIHDNFFELGGDSILSIRIIARAKVVGIGLSPKQFFLDQNIGAMLSQKQETATVAGASQEPVTGTVAWTPIQHWFLELGLHNPNHFNQTVLLMWETPIQRDRLGATLDALCRHHDALRLRFGSSPDLAEASLARPERAALIIPGVTDLTTELHANREQTLDRVAQSTQASLDLVEGPLIAAHIFEDGDSGIYRLLISVHHVAIDAVSWPILLEDLAYTYKQLGQEAPVLLPAKTTSWKYRANGLAERAKSSQTRAELPFWLSRQGTTKVPIDFPWATATGNQCEERALGAEESKALLHIPARGPFKVSELLITALVQTLNERNKAQDFVFDMEGNGRGALLENEDLSRTLGWFTQLFPVKILLAEGMSNDRALRSVKEQLDRIPNKGSGYGQLRYLDKESGSVLAEAEKPALIFNYLGRVAGLVDQDGLFSLMMETVGTESDPKNVRTHTLDLTCLVVDNRLRCRWFFSPEQLKSETIAKLADQFLKRLYGLLAHCNFSSDMEPLQVQGRLPAPLTHAQQGLWFIEQLDPDNCNFNQVIGWRLRGKLNLPVLNRAVTEMYRRHPILGAYVEAQSDGPKMHTHLTPRTTLRVQDLAHLPGDDPRVMACMKKDVLKRFELDKGPLSRVICYRLAEDTFNLLLIKHHLITDGASMGIFSDELTRLYQAYASGHGSPLPEPSHHYSDYAHWEQAHFSETRLQDLEQFWRERLAGAPATCSVPPDRPRPDHLSVAGAKSVYRFDARLLPVFQSLCQQEHTTMFSALLAGFLAVLHWYSGSDDLIIGTDVSNRALPETQNILGFFINQTVLRTFAGDDPSYRQFLTHVAERVHEMLNYRELPFHKLVEVINPKRSDSHTPLFQVKFTFQKVGGNQTFKDLESEPLSLDTGRSQMDLILNMNETPDSLGCGLEYSTDLYDAESISRFLVSLERVFKEVANNPEIRLSQLKAILDEIARSERKKLQSTRQNSLKKFLGKTRRKAVKL